MQAAGGPGGAGSVGAVARAARFAVAVAAVVPGRTWRATPRRVAADRGRVGALTVAFKASGPVLLGRRELGGRTLRVLGPLAPVMLTALVVTQTVGGDRTIVLDARLAGVAAAAVALWVPLVPAMAVAAVVTALLRAAA